MSETTFNTSQLKDLIKTAIVEILQEQKGLFTDLLVEAMEEVALVNAIEEGQTTERVDRAVIFNLLNQQ